MWSSFDPLIYAPSCAVVLREKQEGPRGPFLEGNAGSKTEHEYP